MQNRKPKFLEELTYSGGVMTHLSELGGKREKRSRAASNWTMLGYPACCETHKAGLVVQNAKFLVSYSSGSMFLL